MLVAGPVWAQQGGTGGVQAGGTAYYTFARPGQNTIEVLVLGGGRSGIYEIGENINLGKLMALAGGGGAGGNAKVTVSLFRLEGGERTRVLRERLNALAERPEYPPLREGDVVRIEVRQSQQFGWRDALNIVTTLSSLTFTILRVFDIRR
jgi:protein involved in polysaccharide export with SLBB domain